MVLIISAVAVFLSQPDKVNLPIQEVQNSSQYRMDYKYGVTYTDSTYGVKIEFPEGINSYKYKEYKWPSHERVYNPIFEKAFATEKSKFDYFPGSFYLSYDNPVSYGDLILYSVYDIKNCNDAQFCQKYVYSEESSGIVKDGSKPYTFWMRNDNYLIMFGVLNEVITSENSKYKISVK